MRTCSVDGCGKRHVARGFCDKHYQRWKFHGDPLRGLRTPAERFWGKVVKTESCWMWTGSTSSSGYGQFGAGGKGGKNYRAHVWAYEQLIGPVPNGLVLDHTCHTLDCAGGSSCPHRRCVNPDHLEPVTVAENARRGRSSDIIEGRINQCRNGHDLTPENTKTTEDGRKKCRTCMRANDRRHKAKRKEQKKMNPYQPTGTPLVNSGATPAP